MPKPFTYKNDPRLSFQIIPSMPAVVVFKISILGLFILFQTYVFFCCQDEIESVLVLGGGFRIPKVQEILLKAVKK